jgi:MFS family permease
VLVGGVWADRLPRNLVMVASDLVRVGTQGTAAALLLTHHARLWHLIVLMALYGTGAAFFLPASTGLVPQTVRAERLQEANALLSLTASAFSVLGPTVAGVLVATVGPGWALATDAGTFLGSAVFLVGLEVAVTIPPLPRQRFLAELAAGWAEVRSRTWVWVDGLFSALGNAIVLAPLFVLGPVVAKRSLHGATSWAAIITAFGIGAVLGSFLALRLRPRRPILLGWTVLSLFALPSALLAIPAPTIAIAAGALLAGLSLDLANTLFETTLQQYVPPAALSRATSFVWLVALALQPVGFALVGPVSGAIGVRATLIAGAVWAIAATAVAVSIPSVRGLERLDAGQRAASSAEEGRSTVE